MSEIKAIETRYKGYRFRSRLEARWAVFFDSLGVAWEYELQGFDLGAAGWYLPDFRLPSPRVWIEVKPAHDLTDADAAKVIAFDRVVSKIDGEDEPWSVYFLIGSPWFDGEKHEYDLLPPRSPLPSYDRHFLRCPLCRGLVVSHLYQPCGGEWATYCFPCDAGDRSWKNEYPGAYFHKGDATAPALEAFVSPDLMAAYREARSARFEHGESPRV